MHENQTKEVWLRKKLLDDEKDMRVIDFYATSLNTVATQASVLAGFSFGALGIHDQWMLAGDDGLDSSLRFLFVNSCTASVSCNLGAVIVATFCAIQGPKRALLDQNATKEVRKVMREEHKQVMRAHVLGIMFFFASCFSLGFLSFSNFDGTIMACQLLLATYLIVRATMRVFKRLAFSHPSPDGDGDVSENPFFIEEELHDLYAWCTCTPKHAAHSSTRDTSTQATNSLPPLTPHAQSQSHRPVISADARALKRNDSL
jgi:hypothetical protein